MCITKNFIWTTLKAIFSIFRFFFAPSDSRISNSSIWAKYCPPIQTKIDTYDWFCGPGTHLLSQNIYISENEIIFLLNFVLPQFFFFFNTDNTTRIPEMLRRFFLFE